jgi:hypothetical protein
MPNADVIGNTIGIAMVVGIVVGIWQYRSGRKRLGAALAILPWWLLMTLVLWWGVLLAVMSGKAGIEPIEFVAVLVIPTLIVVAVGILLYWSDSKKAGLILIAFCGFPGGALVLLVGLLALLAFAAYPSATTFRVGGGSVSRVFDLPSGYGKILLGVIGVLVAISAIIAILAMLLR